MEKKKKWIITGVILLVILIFGVGIYWYTRPKEVTSYTPEFKKTQEMWRREFRFRDIRRL